MVRISLWSFKRLIGLYQNEIYMDVLRQLVRIKVNRELNWSVKFQNFVYDCYNELDESFVGIRVKLKNDRKRYGMICRLRIPSRLLITFKKFNFIDEHVSILYFLHIIFIVLQSPQDECTNHLWNEPFANASDIRVNF